LRRITVRQSRLWLAPIFIVFHGPQAHVNSCGNRPVRRASPVRSTKSTTYKATRRVIF
jgi:hypothetical protein